MKPVIPYDFDPTSDNFFDHLQEEPALGGAIVSWPLSGVKLFYPIDESDSRSRHANFTKLTESNNGLFKAHGLSGFSVGNYHEFLITSETEPDVLLRWALLKLHLVWQLPLLH